MKKVVTLLLVIMLFTFASCTDTSTFERTWQNDFTVSCKHIEESQFDTDTEMIEALLNGTYVFEQDEYSITNKTNDVFERVYVVFYADFIGFEPYEFKEYVGVLKQGETEIISLTETTIALGANYVKFPDGVIFDFDNCTLLRIEYEVTK